jgi:hypothetical protein
MKRRLRLLKVIVQPVFVVDDGETLSEVNAQPLVVGAAEWDEWATSGFDEAFETLRREVESGEEPRMTD